MKEIICANQAELNAVSVDFDGRVIIKFGTPYNRAIVNRRFKRSVVVWGNSSVEAWENSSVVARGNSQVVDAVRKGNIKTSGNARVVYNPANIDEYIEFHGLDTTADTVKLYKAVHLVDGEYCADWCDFIYKIGDMAVPNGFCEDPLNNCGAGIHLANMDWALRYGQNWADLAILELECDKADVLIPLYSDGKVRARKAKVIREVPLEECGLFGKIIAKRRVSHE